MSNESERARGLWVALRHQAQLRGFSVAVRSLGHSVAAYSDYDLKEVVISDALEPLQALGRLTHEVGHVRLHATVRDTHSMPDRGLREIEAELFAYAVLGHNGVVLDDSSLEYVTNWAFSIAPKAPEHLIDAICEQLVPEARQFAAELHNYLRDHMRPTSSRPAESPFLGPDSDGPVL